MTDIAKLGFSADTSDLKDATASLNALVPAAKRAETAAKGVTAAAAGLAGGIKPFSAAVQQAATGAGTLSRSALLAGTAMGTVERSAVGASAAIGNLGGTVARVGMNFAQADAHVEAYRKSLLGVTPAANGAKSSLDRLGASANDNINAMQATPGNIAAQFQDIGVTAAAGMNPLIIALQQGTQLSSAFSGGLGNIGAALKQIFSPVSLLTIGIVGLIAVGIQWAMTAFNASEATETLSEKLDKVKFASNAVSDAQGILANVMDLATGKVNAQSAAFVTLAKAQLLVARVQSQVRAQEARTAITEAGVKNIAAGGGGNFQTGMAGGGAIPSEFRRSAAGDVANLFQRGLITADTAIERLETLRAAGKVTNDVFANLAANIANYGAEIASQGVFDDALRLLEGDMAGTGYLLKPEKGRTGRGGKSEAEKFSDIVTGAQNDIATQKTRELNAALADNVELVARAEQRTKLLNEVQSKGITLTPEMRDRIEELAVAYGKASAAASAAEATFDIGRKFDDRMRSLAQAEQQVGLYGQALATLRNQQELLNAAEDAGIKIVGDLTEAEAAYVETLRQQGIMLGMREHGNDRDKFMENQRRQHEDTMLALGRERGELGLTGEALAAYRIETDMLAEARAKNLELTDPELSALRKTAQEQAHVTEIIRKQKEALQDQRDTARGFFNDWFDGIREGKNIFESFVDSVIGGLERIAQKMLDRTIDKFLDMMFAGNNGSQGSGILNAILSAAFGSPMGGISKSPGMVGTGGVKGFAKGGVVDRPTFFSFANGGAIGQMGEAGEEGILPLHRGPDGSLGVQGHGMGGTVINAPVEVNNHYTISGAVSSQDIIAMVKQGSEQTKRELSRELPSILAQYQTDGTIAA